MNWFYAVDGQKNGPISDSQLDELLRSGTINRNTLVWCDGMANWQPLADARPGGFLPAAGTATGVKCVECGRVFPPSDLIQIHQSSVCAACKPVFLQRLSEGAAMPSSIGLWRQNKRVVTVNETTFPDRCVKCNEPANGFCLKRTLYWQHPAYLLLILCNLLILLIVVLIVRKKAVVHIGLCEKHRANRTYGLTIGWLGFLGGLAAIIGGAIMQSWITVVIGVVLILVGAVFGIAWGRTVYATKITKENVWVGGVNSKFLENLPDWPGV